MQQIIDPLARLSDNFPLFEYLRSGGDLKGLADSQPMLASVPGASKGDLLQAFREAILPALHGGELTAVNDLIDRSEVNARVTILGELILTLYALKQGSYPGEVVQLLLERAFRLSLELAKTLEATQPQDTDDADLLAHGIAMREWAHLLAGFYELEGIVGHRAEMLMIRARVTNSTLSTEPHLVGPAMIDIALALEEIDRADMAVSCYNGVRMDLRYLLDRVDDPTFPENEKRAALYWLQRACEELRRLVPDDRAAAEDLEEARQLRQTRGHAGAVSAPRLGPIAKTYLDRTAFLALIIAALEESYDPTSHDESVAAICERFGCASHEVAFYLSAMGSYQIRGPMTTAGVTMMYDSSHHEVFSAIDFLRCQEREQAQDGP